MKSFCIMVANVRCLHRSHIQTAKNICLIYWKALTQATLCYKLATFCPLITEVRPKMWFPKDHDLESSTSSVNTNGTIRFLDLKKINLDTKIGILNVLVLMLSEPCHPPIHTRVKFYQNLIASFFFHLQCSNHWPKGGQGKKKEEKQEK